MIVTIHTFAILKETLPQKFDLEISDQFTAGHVIKTIVANNPECSEILDSCRIAVNEEFVDYNHIIAEGTQLYLLPPSSGG